MRETAILERDLTRALEEIRPADEERMAQARRHWDAVAKPLHGLGLLEDVVVRMAGVAPLGRDLKKAVAAFCADNGVVAQGVTQTDSSVTAVVSRDSSRVRLIIGFKIDTNSPTSTASTLTIVHSVICAPLITDIFS